MTLIEAAKLACEALQRSDYLGWQLNIPIIKALKQAITEAEQQEPDHVEQHLEMVEQQEPRKALTQPDGCQCPACKVTPHASDCAVHNEPAYSKGTCNCKAQPEQQEPVKAEFPMKLTCTNCGAVDEGTLIIEEPPKCEWQGLTDNEIALVNADYPHPQGFARAIETKLKEKNA